MIAFHSPKGVFCYKVMPFSLKNIGATYQHEMAVIYKEMLGNILECFVDDLVVKRRQRKDQLGHLQVVFNMLMRHQLKMNLLKWAF